MEGEINKDLKTLKRARYGLITVGAEDRTRWKHFQHLSVWTIDSIDSVWCGVYAWVWAHVRHAVHACT